MTTTAIIKNKAVWLFVVLYVAALAYLAGTGALPTSELLPILILVGGVFSLVAWFSTRWTRPLPVELTPNKAEMWTLAGYIIFLTLYLAWGTEALDSLLGADPERGTAAMLLYGLAKKLVFFVLVPVFIFRRFFGATLQNFGLSIKECMRDTRGWAIPVVVMSAVLLAFQFFLGQAAAPIREGAFTGRELATGLPLAFLWLCIEVGLVEEFFFRGFLQARLAAFFNSEVTGIALMALIFGLAHAPGLYLRAGAGLTPLGLESSFLDASAYSIAILAIAGLFMGVLWMRTKNLWVLIPIHAAGDLLQGFPEFAKAFLGHP